MTHKLTEAEVKALRELLEKAIGGPWRACPVNRDGKEVDGHPYWVCPCASVHTPFGIAASVPAMEFGPDDAKYHEQPQERQEEIAATMDLIAALRNAAPALLATAEREAKQRAVVEAAKQLRQHPVSLVARFDFDEALAALDAAAQGQEGASDER
jgi:hypothetical protein